MDNNPFKIGDIVRYSGRLYEIHDMIPYRAVVLLDFRTTLYIILDDIELVANPTELELEFIYKKLSKGS